MVVDKRLLNDPEFLHEAAQILKREVANLRAALGDEELVFDLIQLDFHEYCGHTADCAVVNYEFYQNPENEGKKTKVQLRLRESQEEVGVMAENFIETPNGIFVNGDNPECKGRTAWRGSEVHLWSTHLTQRECDLLNANADPKTIRPKKYLGSSKDWKIIQLEAALTKGQDDVWNEAIEAAYRIKVASVDQIEAGISDPPDWFARHGRAVGFNKGVEAKQRAIRRLRKVKP